MRIGLRSNERHLVLEVQPEGDTYRIHDGSNEKVVRAEFLDEQTAIIEIDGERQRVTLAREGDVFFVAVAGEVYSLTREQPTSGGSQVAIIASPEIVAPMPGKVIRVLVKAGERVVSGDTILILEAMKMENRLLAEASATVEDVRVNAGDLVDGGQVLAVLRYDEDASPA